MKTLLHSLRLWCLLVLSACLTLASHAEGEKPTPTSAAGPRLKESDSISMTVYKQDDLSTTASISKSGEIAFPLIGSVKLAGLTVAEATEKVRSLYAEKYLVDPSVTIMVTGYGREMISVTGAVRGPGQFTLPGTGKFGLAAAIAAAGGLDARADRNRIVVYRASGATQTYTDSSLATGSYIPIGAGDRIVVMDSPFLDKKVSILGQVGRPGPVAFPLSGKLDIISAIAGAGGFTRLANTKKVTINRGGKSIRIDVKELSETASEPYYLQPDDIVTVPERLF